MCRSSNSSDSSCNLTNSSLITVGYQLRFLALLCTRPTDLACTWYYYVMLCNLCVVKLLSTIPPVLLAYKSATCRLAILCSLIISQRRGFYTSGIHCNMVIQYLELMLLCLQQEYKIFLVSLSSHIESMLSQL